MNGLEALEKLDFIHNCFNTTRECELKEIVKKDLEIFNMLKSQIKITSIYETKNKECYVVLENIRTQTETHIKLTKEEYERLKELWGNK